MMASFRNKLKGNIMNKPQSIRGFKELKMKILLFSHKILLSVVPKNRYGDKFICFVNFIVRHKRLPTNKLIFNDVLYKIKTTEEIMNPLRVFVSDKEFVKLYVTAIVGEKYNVPTIDIIRDVETIDNYQFPSDCCIKPTQASGKVILRKENSPINISEIKSWFKLNYYKVSREANYKTLKSKVIIEPLIFNNSNLEDYKPKIIQVDIDRYLNHTRKFLNIEWEELDFSISYPKNIKPIPKPNNFSEMLSVATELSKGFSFVRVDLYSNGNQILVGELTNCHGSAGESFSPFSGERYASKLIFR